MITGEELEAGAESEGASHNGYEIPARGASGKKYQIPRRLRTHASFTHPMRSHANRQGKSQDGQGGQLAILRCSDRTIDRDSGDHFSDDRLRQSRNMNQASDLLRSQESGDHVRAMIT